ncbi:O-glycosyl hydrolase [Paenibacillus cellulosilyticus]|uniref:O-glycosyl hydrolase n=1 Tax=Paenibacillus cellulosilyticus TaxID=375489 RepID=A0A2V2YR31_9BACL|nr:glycoside hydrolase [Paenibacillus cellulosilyticus]PWV99537.1 O-glycosyl hydrolase [Paenibacillus cellulosilyticus]QKS44786.1 xylanase [Paenibacillus cellulosilyticus]
MFVRKKRVIIPIVFLLLCLVISSFVYRSVWQRDTGSNDEGGDVVGDTIQLNYDKTYQKIDGFGASGAWWAQDVGGWDNISDIMDLLYDSKKGIGLNIYRYNIGAGQPTVTDDPWRSTQSVEVSPGVYDLSRDKNAINAMKEAVKRGASVELFANSPPARLTKSGYSSGDPNGLSNLPTENEEAFATYLVDITELFLKEGIPVTYLSPINEPQWDWKSGQEGNHYEPEQVISLSRKVALELQKRDLPVKLLIAESGTWNDPNYTLTMYKRIMDDEVLSKSIDSYAVHSYWASERDKRIAAEYFEQFDDMLPLYQTEWCEMVNGGAATLDAALVLAKTIHEDMTILNVSTWEQWLAVAKGDYRDGLVYVNESTREFGAAKRMWSFGNYAKFIKPGYQRIQTDNEDSDVLVSAYVSPDKKKTVIVAINQSLQEKPVNFGELKGNKASIYETSNNADLALVKEVKGLKHYVLPAESVTTFEIQTTGFFEGILG